MKFETYKYPVAIIVGCLLVGGSLLGVQINKQNSIEKQAELRLEQELKISEEKSNQERKKYATERKKDCYQLEESEKKNWNNVEDAWYDEEEDECVVQYKNDKWREGDPFFSGLGDDGKWHDGKYFTKRQ
jgi:hypothetical protein